jgi:transposase InsO family protein
VTTDQQVRRLREEMSKHGRVGRAAMRSGMDRKTARKYVAAGKLPSEMKTDRSWRTRADPFAEDWDEAVQLLRDVPGLEAKIVFGELCRRRPDRHQAGELRTFQRRVKQWRALEGPAKEVFFPQAHRPGEAIQTDFTQADVLKVTVAGVLLEHKLCTSVLPYSNWTSATVCRSESLAALKRGMQTALFRLGCVPEWHQTDNSTAATHDLGSGKRAFNVEYERIVEHFRMKARTIGIGKSNQNGDVESLQGVMKRMLEQCLLLRGSRDFESVASYEEWVWEQQSRSNGARSKRVGEDIDAMKPLDVQRLPEWVEVRVTVNRHSTIRVKSNGYSVPSRLVGEQVSVRVFDDRLEVWYGQKQQLVVERLLGSGRTRIDYRHVIWSLVRKPGAFSRYRHREQLFPSLSFRRAYDALTDACSTTYKSDLEYLRLLHLAASTLESEVDTALGLLLEQGTVPTSEAVRALVSPVPTEVPDLEAPTVDLSIYDALMPELAGAVR